MENVANTTYSSPSNQPTRGHLAADALAKRYGSWWFLGVQALIMVAWITFNILAVHFAFDPFPFVLLNLFMSAEAAFATPIILMAENRSSQQAQERNEKILASIQQILDIQTQVILETRNATIPDDNLSIETNVDPETLETEIKISQG